MMIYDAESSFSQEGLPRDSGKRICWKNKEGVKMSEWKQTTPSKLVGTVVSQPNITSIDVNNSNGSLQ